MEGNYNEFQFTAANCNEFSLEKPAISLSNCIKFSMQLKHSRKFPFNCDMLHNNIIHTKSHKFICLLQFSSD